MCRTPLVSWELSHKMLCVMSLLIVWQVVSPWREYGSLHVTSHSQSWLRYTSLALGLTPSMFSPAGHPQLLAFSEQLHGGKTLCWLLGALQRGVRRHLCPCATCREWRVCTVDGKRWPQCHCLSRCLPLAECGGSTCAGSATMSLSLSGAPDWRTCSGLGGQGPGFQWCQITPCSVSSSIK